MFDPLVLHQSDMTAVLTERAGPGADPLGLGMLLTAPVSSGHKIARAAIPAGTPVIKFGQATKAIDAGAHVHTHNCTFANPEKDCAIGSDLASAQAAIPQTDALTF